MLEERYEKILDLLHKRSRMSVGELADLLLISQSTVRRDLAHLESKQQVRRIHGGVELVDEHPFAERTLLEKQAVNPQEKQAIAQRALQLLSGYETVYLDAGSTTDALIPFMAKLKTTLTVVTNSVSHAAKLADLGIPVMMIGGKLKLTTNAIVGADALAQIQNLMFDVSFLGIDGVSIEQGYTTPDTEEAAMKRTVMSHSRQTVVLADASKFLQNAFSKVADLNDTTLVTTSKTGAVTDLSTLSKVTHLIITEA